MIRVRLLGVGSPLGDDAIGWQVIEALRDDARLSQFAGCLQVETFTLDRPGASLVTLLAGVERVIIIDALLDGRTPGCVRVLNPAALAPDAAGLSVHGFGVASALALAAVLDDTPAEVCLLGISISGVDPIATSETVRAAVPRALDTLFAELQRMAASVAG